MAENPVKILVAARDATLRQEAFDRLSAAGYRLDAVGDRRSAEKRVARDAYDLLVGEEELLSPSLSTIPCLFLTPGDEGDLLDRVQETLEPGSGPDG